MSRISIEVTPAEHKAVKALALLEGMSIKELLWGPAAQKIKKHMELAKKQKGYGAGHPDCPLCQKYAKNGRYNAKTERGLRESMKEIRQGKAKRYKNAEEAIRDLRS
jgi:hypothetical protein